MHRSHTQMLTFQQKINYGNKNPMDNPGKGLTGGLINDWL